MAVFALGQWAAMDLGLSKTEKAQESLEIYLQYRLSLLSTSIRENILDIMKRRMTIKTLFNNDLEKIDDVDSKYLEGDHSIWVSTPEVYSGTIPDYFERGTLLDRDLKPADAFYDCRKVAAKFPF
jgi:hypothetical protein